MVCLVARYASCTSAAVVSSACGPPCAAESAMASNNMASLRSSGMTASDFSSMRHSVRSALEQPMDSGET